MKKIVFPVLLISLVNQILLSQPVTSISGKVENYQNKNFAELIIETYNSEKLEIKKIKIDSKINESDGTFQIITTDVIEPYTPCWIRLNYDKVPIVLNPGESIYISANLRYLEQSIEFSGRDSGKNQYKKEFHLQFTVRNATKKIRKTKEPRNFLSQIKELTEKKHQLLHEYLQNGIIDSLYYNYESTRLKYVLYKEVLRHFKSHTEKYLDVESMSTIEETLKNAEINNEEFLLSSDYRSFVKYYVYYKTLQQNEDYKASFPDQIYYAQLNLQGRIYQYVVKHLIEEFSRNANNKTELVIGLNNVSKKINDPLLLKTIDYQYSRAKRNRVESELTENALGIVTVLAFLFALIYLLRYFRKHTKLITKKPNVARWLIYSIYVLSIIIILSYIENNSSRNAPYLSLLFLFLAVIYIIHTFLIIPRFIKKTRKYLYFITLVILLGISVAFALFVRSLAIKKGLSWDSSYEIAVYSITWLIVTLAFSWFGYYMHYLAKKRLPFSHPFKEKMVNNEIIIVTLILLIVNIIFAANVYHRIKLTGILTFYTAIALFLIQTFWFVPKYLFQKKFSKFLIFNILLLIVLSFCMIFTSAVHSFITLSARGIDFDLMDLININYSVRIDKLFSSMLIIIPASFYNYIKYLINERETEGFRLYRNKEAELMHLRSQVNPHFLFNNLNTLYSFALKEKSERTAESIAKLANLMRYMIDDMDKETIALKKEVEYIQDYIKLQSIRSSVEHKIQMNVAIDHEEECMIAPMLLIPFVENAFKHGINPNKVSELLIDIKGQKDEIQFVIENNVDEKIKTFYKEKGFGIGIENVRKRLEYIYPQKHNISVANVESRFIVILSIKINT